MVLHVWEVQWTASDYYFFDENCSYNILFFLEAARPSVNLTDQLSLWVIPSDTIRIVRDQGLVSSVRYRPSQGTRIRHLASFMKRDDQKAALDIASGMMNPEAVRQRHEPPEQGRILELAAEFLQYRYSRQELEKEIYTREFHAILKERSSLGETAGQAPPVPVPTSSRRGACHRQGRSCRRGMAWSVLYGTFRALCLP